MFRNQLSIAVIAALNAARAMPGAIGRVIMPSVHRSFRGEIDLPPMTYGHRGAGISMAQQKRASRKVKNVKRHRAAIRG